jgi:ribose-phosphate pyrophosphokinase
MIIEDFKLPVINLNTGEGVKIITFPDGQPHMNVNESPHLSIVVCSITSPSKLLELQMLVDALRSSRKVVLSLHIPYLMGARYDRVMHQGDSFDLKVIATIINALNIRKVVLYDPHSDVAAALIENVKVVTNQKLVEAYDKEDAVMIIPDAGAAKKAFDYPKWNPKITDYVQALKHRDTKTGEISHTEIIGLDKCHERNCVIIDDICDGGRTFVEIAKILKGMQVAPKSITLIVTHGIFSKGFDELGMYFDQIITSNSLFKTYPLYTKDLLKVVEYEF